MAIQLTFEGDVIGDHFVKATPADQLLTSPAKRIGLYQSRGAINADSRNYLYGRQFTVVLKRDNPVLLMEALQTISELMGQTGDLVLTYDTDIETMEGWTIEDVSAPGIPEGFGGRLAREIIITAMGATPPVYS